MSKISELDIVKLSEFDQSKITSLLSNSRKLRTILQFNEVAGNNRHATQTQICGEVGVSVATINRMRKELNVRSPYRNSVPTKTEAQREKDKYRRIVNTAYRSGEINESKKSSLYSKINSNLVKGVKDEILNLKLTPQSNTSAKSLRGGTLEEMLAPERSEPPCTSMSKANEVDIDAFLEKKGIGTHKQ